MALQLEERGNLRGSTNACISRVKRSAPDQNIQKYGPCGHADLHCTLRMLLYHVLRTSNHAFYSLCTFMAICHDTQTRADMWLLHPGLGTCTLSLDLSRLPLAQL